MSKLPKEKKQQLVLVSAVTVVVLVGLWFGLINLQQQNLGRLANKREKASIQLQQMESAIKNASLITGKLEKTGEKVSADEENMASGDLNAWMFSMIRQFKLPYKVDIPQFSSVVVEPATIIPGFPYKQVTITIGGTAYYHDLGRFIADLENQYPDIRVENLDMQPASSLASSDPEKLAFKMDVVALAKSSGK